MGGSSNSSDSSNQGQFQQQVWGGQTPALQNLYSLAGSLFNQTNGGMQGQIPGAVNGINQVTNQVNPAWQNQMQGGAYGGLNIGNQLMSSLQQSQNTPSNEQEINNMIMGGQGNNYVDAMNRQMRDSAATNLGGSLAMNDLRANMAGQGGSSRHGITESGLYNDANTQLFNAQTNMGYNTFDKDLNRKLQIAQNADQNNFGRQQLMSQMLGDQQNTMNTGIQGAQQQQNLNMGQFAPYMQPWSAMGEYGNVVGRPTLLGSGSQGGQSSSKSMGASMK
jgi:hypothetical protein